MNVVLFRRKRARGEPGAALAVAMLVVVMLTAIGIVALNAASYDVASAGALRQSVQANAVADTGLAVGRCELCESLDGVITSMDKRRATEGRSPQFVMAYDKLLPMIDAPAYYEASAGGSRDSFGYVGAAPSAEFWLRLDRPRESKVVAGYSLREGAVADTGSLCFRRFRLTAQGQLASPGVPWIAGSNVDREYVANHRAYILAGPVECSGG